MNTVQFLGYTCKVEEHRYKENDRIALELVDATTEEPIATVTTNLGREPLEPQEIIIKNYSENEGIYNALLEAGIISPVKRRIATGWVEVLVCDYLNYNK